MKHYTLIGKKNWKKKLTSKNNQEKKLFGIILKDLSSQFPKLFPK